ncbi:lva [Trypoxylus dichotomus]
MDVDDMWFQQDGATCDTAEAMMDILRERFEDMVTPRKDQVLEIDDLQKELYEKSSLYDALIAEVDITHKSAAPEKSKKRVQFSDDVQTQRNASFSSNEDDLAEPVSRAELDLALYMLHQRDVRCEELTVELMQLLEERDTLQLKLSNAPREKEQLVSKYESSSESASGPSAFVVESASPSDIASATATAQAAIGNTSAWKTVACFLRFTDLLGLKLSTRMLTPVS